MSVEYGFHSYNRDPDLSEMFRFLRPGIRNLRKAEGFIEEFSEQILSSKVILKWSFSLQQPSKTSAFLNSLLYWSVYMKDLVFSERFFPIILKCLRERHCLFREIFKLPQVNRGFLNFSIVDDPYVKFEKRRARVQQKRVVNSVEFANFKTLFLSNQQVAQQQLAEELSQQHQRK